MNVLKNGIVLIWTKWLKHTKILMLIILVVIGVATHLFLTPSTIETSGSKNITDMINRTVEVLNEVNNVIATSPPMAIVLYDCSGKT